MATEQDFEKLKDVMEFPAKMTFKVAGINREGLAADLVAVVQQYLKGDYTPRETKSSKGTYNSVSIDIVAENFDQVETLYKELAKVDGVKLVI
ncbi:DUF493 family protein YbeD [Mannheimia massilioguelmaensis]|uniref:DUF493 family protein YbeD n=1 Tax=Mannheimia massilioguelmaensis TaxID=1604354 RepID=UPI0005C8BC8B|nr:DUF493 family protein YbeD [Mannheimia massilioguelmaensis]